MELPQLSLSSKPEPWWFKVAEVIKGRDQAIAEVKAAFKLKQPNVALYYRQGLRNLLGFELQLDAICFTFDITRVKLYEWVKQSEKEIKELEKNERKSKQEKSNST